MVYYRFNKKSVQFLERLYFKVIKGDLGKLSLNVLFN